MHNVVSSNPFVTSLCFHEVIKFLETNSQIHFYMIFVCLTAVFELTDLTEFECNNVHFKNFNCVHVSESNNKYVM